MSVQCNQYLMFGALLPESLISKWEETHDGESFIDHFEDYADDSAFSRKIGGKDGLFICEDYMSGKYTYIGEVLAKSSDEDVLETTEIPTKTEHEANELTYKIEALLGLGIPQLGWHLITRYS